MKTVADLLDAAKVAQELPSDSALARAVGVTRGSISNWRNGVSLPDPVACAALAGLTGEPLARVLGIVGEARAISREEKAVWRRLATTAMLLLIVVVPALNPAAAYFADDAANAAPTMHYAKWWATIGRLLHRVTFGLFRGYQAPALLA